MLSQAVSAETVCPQEAQEHPVMALGGCQGEL